MRFRNLQTMRKTVLFFILSAFSLCLPAQENVIDKVQYRITYKTMAVKDTTKHDSIGNYVYYDDEMRLDIGDSINKFYSGREATYLKWINDKIEKGDMDLASGRPASPHLNWIVYYNYPEGETSYLDKFIGNLYRISEKTMTPDWKVDSDTCTILGYKCTKAEADFKGRHWTVWYAEDIPLNYGPWKLIGLPGLVLKAEDQSRQYLFTVEGLEQIGGKEDITLAKDYKKYEQVSQRQFDKIMRSSSPLDALAAQGIKIEGDVKIVSSDPSKHEDHTKLLKKIMPYNPIEIAE